MQEMLVDGELVKVGMDGSFEVEGGFVGNGEFLVSGNFVMLKFAC